MQISEISLNLYSFGYSAGFIHDPKSNFLPISLEELIKKSKNLGLGGIEFPFDRFFSYANLSEGIELLINMRHKNINYFLDFEKFDTSYLEKVIPILSKNNVNIARIKMDQMGKTIYGGNRFKSHSFGEEKKGFIKKLKRISRSLKEYNFILAIENHQDLHSKELVEIIDDVDSDFIGINWDVGNSISCLDTPDSFYARTKDFIRNVHLKDYKVYESEEGIRLVRCPIGDGYVNFERILKLIDENKRINSYSIELGAQITRECFIKDETYWKAFRSHPINKSEYFEFVNAISLKNGSSLSPYEKGFDKDALLQSEDEEVKKSAKNLSKLINLV